MWGFHTPKEPTEAYNGDIEFSRFLHPWLPRRVGVGVPVADVTFLLCVCREEVSVLMNSIVGKMFLGRNRARFWASTKHIAMLFVYVIEDMDG